MVQRLAPALPSMLLITTLIFLPIASPVSAHAETVHNEDTVTECLSPDDCPDQQTDANEEESYPKIVSEEAEAIRSALEDVLNSDKFGEHYQEREYSIAWDKLFDWDWQWDKDDEEQDKDNMLKWADAIKDFVDAFKYLVMTLILIAIVYTLAKYKPWMYLPQFRQQSAAIPDEVLGINLKQESLSPEAFSKIEQQLKSGQLRKALSMMLQYHLLRAVKKNRVPFKKSSTESECVVLMESHCDSDEALGFSQLVNYWQQLAYAHDALNHVEVNQFFKTWQMLVQDEEPA